MISGKVIVVHGYATAYRYMGRGYKALEMKPDVTVTLLKPKFNLWRFINNLKPHL